VSAWNQRSDHDEAGLHLIETVEERHQRTVHM
jgi:hypothetical protein